MKDGPFGARKPWEPSRMRLCGPLTLDEVLASFVGAGAHIESTFGAQLEAAREQAWSAKEAPGYEDMVCKLEHADPWRAMEAAEQRIGRDVAALRCLDGLREMKMLAGKLSLKTRSAMFGLSRLLPGASQGELVVRCLSAYHEWLLFSKERALAEVFAWSKAIAGASVDAFTLAQNFREGEAPAARSKAASLYADAYLVLDEWIRLWNKNRA